MKKQYYYAGGAPSCPTPYWNGKLLHENSLAGIAVSVVIICIATARLFVDYEVVTRAVEPGVDAKYEPYYAFGL